eukprot:1760188-Pleurochrysis_carterae.AAC.1
MATARIKVALSATLKQRNGVQNRQPAAGSGGAGGVSAAGGDGGAEGGATVSSSSCKVRRV